MGIGYFTAKRMRLSLLKLGKQNQRYGCYVKRFKYKKEATNDVFRNEM